jgi:hypothetical protein
MNNTFFTSNDGYTCFVYVDQLDEEKESDKKLIDILDEIVVIKTEDDEDINKQAVASVKNKKSETTKKVVDIAVSFFNKAGLEVNENVGSILYTSYDYNSSKYADYDGWVDSYTSGNHVDTCTHQCIIVTKKGENLKGGDIQVYKKDPETFLNYIGYEQEEKNIYELKTGSVLVFSGETVYKPQSFKGNGYFNFITVSLKDKNAVIYE